LIIVATPLSFIYLVCIKSQVEEEEVKADLEMKNLQFHHGVDDEQVNSLACSSQQRYF